MIQIKSNPCEVATGDYPQGQQDSPPATLSERLQQKRQKLIKEHRKQVTKLDRLIELLDQSAAEELVHQAQELLYCE